MRRNSSGFSRLLLLIAGISLIGSSVSIPGQQAPPQAAAATLRMSWPEGLWFNEGNPGSTLYTLIQMTATGQKGVFQVEGAFLDMATGKPYRHIEGTYRKETNQLRAEGRLLTDPSAPVVPMEGGIFLPSDGGYQRLRITYTTPRDMGMHTLNLTWDPDSVPQQQSGDLPSIAEANRQLEITSSAVDPAETESGKPVILKYEYRATQIPDTALQIEETLTITCPEGPPVEAKGTCRLSDFQHGDAGRMDGAGKRVRSITASKPGTYKCRIELKGAGYSASAVREVTFTVKRDTSQSQTGMGATTGANTGAAAIPPGTPIWVLKKADIDPQKIAENDAKQPERERQRWQVSPNSASATYQAPIGNPNNGPMMQVSVTFGGAVPSVLRPGDKFDITMTLKAGPEKNISGGMGIGGRVAASGLKVTRTPADVVEGAGALSGGFVANRQITYHCEVPKDSSPRNQSEIIVARIVSGRGSLAVCHYVADVASATTPGAGNQGSAASDNATGTTDAGPQVVVGPAAGGEDKNNLRAWLASPLITLVPGEPSQIDGVYVSGWRNNTADRVEVDMEVVDNWGSLKVNPKIVAAPGPTSADPGNMTSGEHYFSEMWSARLGARPGTFRIPIIVRQKGAGAAAVTLTVIIPPKFRRDGGAAVAEMPDARPAGGEGGNNLRPRLASPTIDLVPGEPSQIDGVYVRGWRNNTADRVEVDMELADNWGSLKVNPKIVAAPAPTSEDPANMTSGEHYFSLMWSARLGAQPGTFYVPITVRQKGAGAATVTLTVRILPKSTRLPGATGSSGGIAGTLPGPKPGVIVQDGGKFDHVALTEFGCDMERIGGKVIVGVMTRDSVFLKAGLQPGDEIKAVNKKDVTGLPLAEIAAMLRQNRGKNVYLFVARGDKEIFSTFCRVP